MGQAPGTTIEEYAKEPEAPKAPPEISDPTDAPDEVAATPPAEATKEV